jgi:hypothetical protein
MMQGGKHLILKRLGLEEFFSGPVCDRERKPYSPSIDGWNNGICLLNFTNLKCLELRNMKKKCVHYVNLINLKSYWFNVTAMVLMVPKFRFAMYLLTKNK